MLEIQQNPKIEKREDSIFGREINLVMLMFLFENSESTEIKEPGWYFWTLNEIEVLALIDCGTAIGVMEITIKRVKLWILLAMLSTIGTKL